MKQNQNYFPSLTGLKAVMCLIIVLYHTLQPTPLVESIPASALLRYLGGDLGNGVFFMISGFLMVNTYRDRIRSGCVAFGPFVYHKVAKFYSLYLLTNFLSMILRGLRYGSNAINLHDLAMVLLLQNGGLLRGDFPYNGATWFVCMLLVCNIVFFAVCRLTKNLTAYRCALVGVITWGYIALTHEFAFPGIHSLMGVGLVNYFLGCALAEVYPAISRQTHQRFSYLTLAILAVSGILIIRNGVVTALGGLLPGIAFGLAPLILYSALANPLLSRLLSCKPMQSLGKITISLFFWHMVLHEAILQLVQNLTGAQILTDLQYLGYLLLTLAVSFLSYRYLEKAITPKKRSEG